MDALIGMDAEKAEAFKVSDRDMIFQAIREDGGFAKLNNLVKDQLREWFVEMRAEMADEIIAAGGEEAESAESAAYMFNLGVAYKSRGENDRALEYYERSLKIRLAILGENHPDTAGSYMGVGNAYDNKGKYDSAIFYYERSLKIRLATLGENHPDTTALYTKLGKACGNKGENDRALEYYERSLKIRLATLGENHPDTAASYMGVGNAYDNKGKYDRAIEYYERSLKICLATLGKNHPDTIRIKRNIRWSRKEMNYLQRNGGRCCCVNTIGDCVNSVCFTLAYCICGCLGLIKEGDDW